MLVSDILYSHDKFKHHAKKLYWGDFMKLFYCRVGWMNAYRGNADEKPQNGGAYNKDNIGHEVHNYLGVDGKYYGFVEAGVNNSIHVDRLGAGKKDEYTEGILVVWVASHPNKKGQYIVGWYENATVYKDLQNVPDNIMESRTLKTHSFYNIYSEKVTLLDVSERTYLLEGMGHSNIWYGNEETDLRVYDYIKNKDFGIDDRIISIESDTLEGAEKKTIIKARVNQDVFRNNLIKKYGCCVMCKLTNSKLLVASHIKPWSVSDKHEKLDVYNGLLLCPNHDRLFDSGLISFDDEGKILISSEVDSANRILTNIRPEDKISLDEDMKTYMRYHREHVFKA